MSEDRTRRDAELLAKLEAFYGEMLDRMSQAFFDEVTRQFNEGE